MNSRQENEMGLDIRYYERTQFHAEPDDLTYDEAEEKNLRLLTESEWPGRLEGIKPGWSLCFGANGGFRAGSYGGYNSWRRNLCQSALNTNPENVWRNSSAFDGRPFVELIDFTDCDGVIGPVVSKKLAKDFQEHRDQYVSTADEWDIRVYDDFAHAFLVASRADGVVIFT